MNETTATAKFEAFRIELKSTAIILFIIQHTLYWKIPKNIVF